jgi:hypothetical protein
MAAATHACSRTDREQVEETLYRYASTIDAGDHLRLRTLLSDDVRARYGARDWIEGADAVVAFIREKGAGVAWQHHLLNL